MDNINTKSHAIQTKFLEYKSPQTFASRFTIRRTIYGFVFLALILGVYVYSKAEGVLVSLPTEQSRLEMAASFSHNIGLNILCGVPNHIETMAGFIVWNALVIMTVVNSIWAFFVSTNIFRGQEDSGRWELILSGQVTQRSATLRSLLGLGFNLFVMYTIMSIALIIIGQVPGIDFGVGAALFFAVALISGPAIFLAVGAVASQLMPNRIRARGLSTAIFGICFFIRAIADVTSARWLLTITPLGWIEKMQPLYDSKPMWVIPVILLVLALSAWAVYLSGNRDMGASIFADKDEPKPHTMLLNNSFTFSFKLMRASIISWISIIVVGAIIYASLTKSATDAFSNYIENFGQMINMSSTTGAVIYLGMVFFILMLMLMAYAASAVGSIRHDEATGYMDNLLVRPISRIKLLMDRMILITIVIILSGLLGGISTWIIASFQQVDIAFDLVVKSGLNMAVPALFILGIGVFSLGVVPRFTSFITYGVIAWSFLVEMLSSGLKLDEWFLDTSLFKHVALAPAADIDWGKNIIILGISLCLIIVGLIVFNKRDLASE